MAKRAALFPGQGAQYVGMGRAAWQKCPAAKAVFEQANAALGFDVAKLCFEGPEARLTETELQQPAILTATIAAVEAWRAAGSPGGPVEAATGLSLGEYAALVFAEALSFDDAVRLVHSRGRFMHEASVQNPGAMASILGLDAAQLQALEAQAAAKGPVVLANFNCPGQIVVSGAVDAVDELCGLATAAGAKRCIKLNVSGAFHSRLMQPAAEKLAAVLERVQIRPPKIPVIANVTASPVGDPSEIRALLVRQITSPVLWEQSMLRLLTDGFGRFVEIGPGKVLAGLMRRIDRNVEMENYEGE